MPNVRGIFVLNTVRFVKETFGAAAHEAVVASLPAAHRGTFLGTAREASWEPLRDVIEYMQAAHRLCAPDEAGFIRRMGRFSGRLQREQGGFGPMVKDAATAMRLAPVIWSSFYDKGRLEIVVLSPREAHVRIHDFPANRTHCERLSGGWETLLGTDAEPVQVTETRCALDGHPWCEMHLVWGAIP